MDRQLRILLLTLQVFVLLLIVFLYKLMPIERNVNMTRTGTVASQLNESITYTYATTKAAFDSSTERSKDGKFVGSRISLGLAVCGEEAVGLGVTLLKSSALSGMHHGFNGSLHAYIFSDTNAQNAGLEKNVDQIVKNTSFPFTYDILRMSFPDGLEETWKNMFKPCAAQRLFFHKVLPNVTEILYLDVDSLVLVNLLDIWLYFKEMSSKQLVALAAEHEDVKIGWYNNHGKHPYYPPLGLNSGVMLMNLTRIRLFVEWEDMIRDAYENFNSKIPWGDQDILNIVFYNIPDTVFLLPCSLNFRPDHCFKGINCKEVLLQQKSIKVLHGNREVFFNPNYAIFMKLRSYFQKFDMSKDGYTQDLIIPFKKDADNWVAVNSSGANPCDTIGKYIFIF